MADLDPFHCPGPPCHDTHDFYEFDHFCDVLDVSDEETPHAFAAWLGHRTDWDGRYEPVNEEPTDAAR